MKKIKFKSIGAVLIGLIAVIILSNGTDMILEASGVFPSVKEQLKNGFTTSWMLLLALVYRTIFMLVGGYITAWLSPNKPMKHVLTLGIIGTVLGILGAIAAWGIAPSWFLILIILLGLPAVWVGGKLNNKKTENILTPQ
jgi:MFS family permease